MLPFEVGFSFYESCCRIRGQLLTSGPEGPMGDILEWLLMDMKSLVDLWTPGAHPSKAPCRQMFGIYNPSADRSRLSED